MKKFISLFLCIAIFGFFPVKAQGVSTSAQASILYCVDNGEVYYSNNENTKLKIASTTKIMTGLLALEYAEKKNINISFTHEMIAEGSSMYLKIGEVLTLKDLATGLLLCSGNDSANAIAIGISGSIEDFTKLMNSRAKEIGMKNTHFANPSGLDHPDHYSTAYDMALLMGEAMKNKAFAEISKMKTANISFIQPKDKITTYSNHNRLLSMYEYCIGGKTGYTMASGRCLVTVAKKDGLTLVAVTLNDRNDFKDHISLYEYGYENYIMASLDDRDLYYKIQTNNGIADSITAYCKEVTNIALPCEDANKIQRKLTFTENLTAPISKGDKVGKITYTLNGEVIAKHSLLSAEDNPVKVVRIWDYIKEFFKNAFKHS